MAICCWNASTATRCTVTSSSCRQARSIAGEDDLSCAKRELEEETGYTASEWREVTTIYPCIGYSDERLAFYLARGLTEGNHGRDPDEFLEILRVPFGEAMDWLRSGKICETKTVIGLFWLEKILHQGW